MLLFVCQFLLRFVLSYESFVENRHPLVGPKHCLLLLRLIFLCQCRIALKSEHLQLSGHLFPNLSQIYRPRGSGQLSWLSAGLVIERSWVRPPGRAAGDISFPVLTFFALILIRCPFCPPPPHHQYHHHFPASPQWHVKDSGHSAENAGGNFTTKHAYHP